MAVNGKALALATAGGISVWTGLTSPTGNPRDVLSKLLGGQSPGAPGSTSLAGPGGAGVMPGASVAGTAIATDAASYIGKMSYCWGGAPATGCTDCSGLVNLVLGRDFRLAIPGYPAGTFDGSAHGPSSFMYPVWSGAAHISRSSVQAGDLLVWMNPVGHIGIALSNSAMVSDLDPAQGTQETPIDGTAAGALVCLRLRTLPAAGTTQAKGTSTAGGRG